MSKKDDDTTEWLAKIAAQVRRHINDDEDASVARLRVRVERAGRRATGTRKRLIETALAFMPPTPVSDVELPREPRALRLWRKVDNCMREITMADLTHDDRVTVMVKRLGITPRQATRFLRQRAMTILEESSSLGTDGGPYAQYMRPAGMAR